MEKGIEATFQTYLQVIKLPIDRDILGMIFTFEAEVEEGKYAFLKGIIKGLQFFYVDSGGITLREKARLELYVNIKGLGDMHLSHLRYEYNRWVAVTTDGRKFGGKFELQLPRASCSN